MLGPNISLLQFQQICRCSTEKAQEWYLPMMQAMGKWGITTSMRAAAFLAQIAKESGCLTSFKENLNYSAEGLANTWPSRYALNPKGKVKVPNDLARHLHRKPELIANYTYANRMGNGSPESGDGWRYRGFGPKQITGKSNHMRYWESAKYAPVVTPEMLQLPAIGSDSAGWYWSNAGCSEMMDRGDYRGVTMAINGGLIGYEDGNNWGIDDRIELFDNAKLVMGLT